MEKIKVGNAPCSWGTLEFEGLEVNPIEYTQMLNELVETGYTATELGDWGFMPTEPVALRKEIESRNLTMLGAYVQCAFKKEEAHAAGREEVLKIARLLKASFQNKPYIILADDNTSEPDRNLYAGRATKEMGLNAAQWKVFSKGVQEIARAVREETGLPTIFHHHSAGYVETPWEIDAFLENTDPSLINLVFDTGHYVFGSGKDGLGSDGDLFPVLERYAERISYVHFKDCHPGIAAKTREDNWDYLKALKHGLFCELGKGCVDFKGVVEWLNKRNYSGWVLVEQDVLPGMGEPKESARRNREFLRSIGL
ncbi:MAG: xylose isomerase [Anaerolinea sp.]|nr:xylose isomerase [Anaerolinea sp.]